MYVDFKITENYDVATIYNDNGSPVSSQNPVDELTELPDFNLPNPPSAGKVLVLSGMPTSAILYMAVSYKAYYNVLAIYTPRQNGAIVFHTLIPDEYPKGHVIAI